jgi:hypothetical protein
MSIINKALTVVSNSLDVVSDLVQISSNLSNTGVTITGVIKDTAEIYADATNKLVQSHSRSLLQDLDV